MGTVTVLKNADLLTMKDGAALKHGNLWIKDGKILKLELADAEHACENRDGNKSKEMSDYEGHDDVTIIDCTGCVIMPGMIDSHVHFDESYMGDFFLASGVTSVRNCRGFESHAKWRDEILEGKRRGPYIYSTGPLLDGEDPTIPHNDNVIINTEEDVEEWLAYTKKYKFPWVKTYPSIEPELYKYVLKRCQEENLPVCGHMTKKMDHKYLADNGYICCEHTSSLPADPEVIRYLAESGMWFCPTHVVCETLPDYVWNGKQLKDLEHYEDLPEYVRNDWEESNRVIIENYRKLNVRPDFQTIIDRAVTFLKYSKKVMAGTDCAYPGIVPGFALADELEKLVDVYGMTKYEALCAATCNPAEHMQIPEQKGSIAEGMDSDLIILEGNPLEDVGNVRKIKYVIQGTSIYEKEALQQRLTAVGKIKKEEVEVVLGKDGKPFS